jgi:hypothetical protein
MLQSVLSVGNATQNTSFPPLIYQNIYNAASSLLLSKLVADFPTSPQNVDMLYPFMSTIKVPVNNGYVQLPNDYRNLLGNPSISVKPDGSDCSGDIKTDSEFKTANNKGGCKSRPVVILNQSEWDLRTTSTYRMPTYDNPFGVMFGMNQIKVCPYDIAKVEIRYIKQEDTYVYGYIMQPDDTYVFDPTTTVDSIWGSNAFDRLFPLIMFLYSEYSRDNSLRDFTTLLAQRGFV